MSTSLAEIHLRQVSFGYDRRRILQGVDLDLGQGQRLGILGPSGAGKSTLLKLIAGLLTPSSGTMRNTLHQHSHAFVFQEPRLLPWASVLENACLGAELRGRESTDTIRARAVRLLVSLGLGDCLSARPLALSGGMRMRVALARALTLEPATLYLDEPFAALDRKTREAVTDSLHVRNHEGGLILVTHDLPEAVYLCQRLVLLSTQGQIVAQTEVQLAPSDTRTDAAFARERDRILQFFAVGHAGELKDAFSESR